jgi:hypothetical protein
MGIVPVHEASSGRKSIENGGFAVYFSLALELRLKSAGRTQTGGLAEHHVERTETR